MSEFDPFQKAWSLYEEGGMPALNGREAPLGVYQADPELADEIAARYADEGLTAADLKFMVMPDAQPVAPVHLVVVGRRQVPYRHATPPERAAMDELTLATEEHLRDVMDIDENGVAVVRFGRIPTMHHHVVAREEFEHGLNWTPDARPKGLSPLADRQAVRERVGFEQTPGRLEEIGLRMATVLHLNGR